MKKEINLIEGLEYEQLSTFYPYLVGWLASSIEFAKQNGKSAVDIENILKGVEEAKKHAQK